jgi:hypothetical protein
MADQQITKKDFESLRNDLHEWRDIFENKVGDKILSRIDLIEQMQIADRQALVSAINQLPKRVADETHQQVLAQVEPMIKAIDEKIENHISRDNPSPHPKQKESKLRLIIAIVGLLVSVCVLGGFVFQAIKTTAPSMQELSKIEKEQSNITIDVKQIRNDLDLHVKGKDANTATINN